MLFPGFPARSAPFRVEDQTEGFGALLRGLQKAADGRFLATRNATLQKWGQHLGKLQ